MSKKIYLFSPQNQSGKTTLGNYLGIALAKERLTALVELNRYAGYSIYLSDSENSNFKSLTSVYHNELLEEHLMQSRHHERFFTLSKNMHDDFLDLHGQREGVIEEILQQLEKNMGYILVELPSNYIEKMLLEGIQTMQYEDHLIIVLDENILTYQLLKNYDHFFKERKLQLHPNRVHFVINKTIQENAIQKIQKILDSLECFLSSQKIILLPCIKELTLYGNEGKIITNPGSKIEKQFKQGVEQVAKEVSNLLVSKKTPKKNASKGFFKKKKN